MQKNNQLKQWRIVIFLGIAYLIGAILFYKFTWISSWLQVGAIAITIAVTRVMTIENNQKIEESTQEQIKTYKSESEKQIKKIEENTDNHIKALQSETAKQMEHLTNLTNKHIAANREESTKQINTVRESTKEQIESFVAQTEAITSRLEDVADQLVELARLSGEMVETEKEIKIIEEESLRQRQEDLYRQQQEIQESIERTMPHISFRLEQKNFAIFLKYIHIYIYNGGGDASLIRLTLSFKNPHTGKTKSFTFSYANLNRGHQVDFQTGRVRHLNDCTVVQIEISAWDNQGREYYAHKWWHRKDYQWLGIEIADRKLLAI
ncbi:MAG: hypothetical protein ACLQQ4_07940 [Bacteroidia bacterium]